MAVPAKPDHDQSLDKSLPPELARYPEENRPHILHAAELYGLGHSRSQIARVLAVKLYGHEETTQEMKLRKARVRLRAWEKQQWFRDLVWDRAVVELDMQGPQILRGIAKKAKRGRVDAAKLAFGITGRYKDKDENIPTQVTINLNAIPRPKHQAVEAGEEIVLGEDED